MRLLGIMLVGALCWGTVHAGDAGQALAQRNTCLACHQVDVKRVGPSFRDVAVRYAGNDAATEYLARVIRNGSRGLWGAIPMPAQRHVDPATALRLAQWIVSLAPERPSDQDQETSSAETGSAESGDTITGVKE